MGSLAKKSNLTDVNVAATDPTKSSSIVNRARAYDAERKFALGGITDLALDDRAMVPLPA